MDERVDNLPLTWAEALRQSYFPGVMVGTPAATNGAVSRVAMV